MKSKQQTVCELAGVLEAIPQYETRNRIRFQVPRVGMNAANYIDIEYDPYAPSIKVNTLVEHKRTALREYLRFQEAEWKWLEHGQEKPLPEAIQEQEKTEAFLDELERSEADEQKKK